ncbi:phosphoenolpyruvate--protein phosphotransferase [Labrenzia sp. 011]|uniref:phosphoenolpyruvate--protein phosphotransferase n=1 Tax=Labrenzia sp. 011 TaxID=2171494 RepID=UPI000D508FE5|nr:phosphoenolpyruvate--protein phosphotransferase [Labrenzia sp. 011]PVB62561.1 phosphoenolpyruvate--protein phosphotransferase [Labrenzia sp. 011]
MIGIVIVSHSRKLAEGLKEIADVMSGQPVPVAAAGGVDDPENPLGTDGVRVLDAIREVMSDEGVLVFADIGSARLNAEMAIDLLEPEEQEKVHFCDAPLVEGVLAAAVQIGAGSPLQAVMGEARQAAAQKPPASEAPRDAQSGGVTREFTIRNPMGLHARPAALLVTAMNAFSGEIRLANLSKGRQPVNAKSINGIMLSEVTAGDRISLTAEPAEAEAVFAAFEELIGKNFGDEATASPPAAPVETPAAAPQTAPPSSSGTLSGTLEGISIASGFALGPLHHVRNTLPEIEPVEVADPAAETERFTRALADAEAEITASLAAAGQRITAYDRKIFDAHISYLHDPEIIGTVKRRIADKGICAEAVWREVVADLAGTYAALEDPLLKARASDIIDVGLRVLRFLTGGETAAAAVSEPSVLAFADLRPSDVLALDESRILGICAMTGGKTSHAAILASALSIPVVFAVGEQLAGVAEGTQVLLDGTAGRLTVAPDPAAIATMKKDRKTWEDRRARAEALKTRPAQTSDGHEIRVAANMASVEELGVVATSGAQEVGLLRTEFLYMRREAAPGEDEQYEVYRTLVAGLEGRPLTVRTADIGGDKPVPYMDRPPEANPNLGWRGLRYSLAVPEFFDVQLAAILRASAHGPVRIMFPLVSTLQELRAAKERVRAVMATLRSRGLAFDDTLEIGMMIEVPAAAEMADMLAPEVDFFSIGTNDLTQYVMAADRANARVQDLFDPFNPAVLRMIARSIEAAHAADIWIGMCGAMAGSPIAAPILLGLGLDEFSMTPSDIAEFKLTVRDLALPDCRTLAADVLKLSSADAVRERVAGLHGG